MRYGAPVSQQLIAAAQADMGERYGSGDETPIEPMEFAPPGGGFVVAYLNGRPIGCGGWRAHGDDGEIAEIKRMYVAPEGRRLGVARRVLAALAELARVDGRRRMILETGDRQPEAVKLYESAGFERIENFGYYRNEPGCVCFGRDL